MNIASFLQPKAEVTYLRDDMTIRQGLEKLKRSGYTAVPVIDSEDRYVGVISEGDFLWHILSRNDTLEEITMKRLEQEEDIERLTQQMNQFAENLEFEKAAALRDKIQKLMKKKPASSKKRYR